MHTDTPILVMHHTPDVYLHMDMYLMCSMPHPHVFSVPDARMFIDVIYYTHWQYGAVLQRRSDMWTAGVQEAAESLNQLNE